MSAEYVITEKSNLQTIADAVRTSTGNTDKFNVSELSSAVVTTIEEGEVTSEIGTYTNLLSQLETTIDTLPDAGSGGGSMEMCTVTINRVPSDDATITYVTDDGETQQVVMNTSMTLPKNRLIVFTHINEGYALSAYENVNVVISVNDDYNATMLRAFCLTADSATMRFER